jgi:hypothetical protein
MHNRGHKLWVGPTTVGATSEAIAGRMEKKEAAINCEAHADGSGQCTSVFRCEISAPRNPQCASNSDYIKFLAGGLLGNLHK